MKDHQKVELVRDKIYEVCPNCSGTGMAINNNGDPGICPKCHGDTVVPVQVMSHK